MSRCDSSRERGACRSLTGRVSPYVIGSTGRDKDGSSLAFRPPESPTESDLLHPCHCLHLRSWPMKPWPQNEREVSDWSTKYG